GIGAELLDAGQIRRSRLASSAKAFIEAHYREPLSLASLSQHFFMSPYRFSHVFKQVNGLPPMVYLTKVRMDNAKRLLGAPELPIKAVASEVGYPDVHYFCRVFVQSEGLTPSAYRRAHLLPE
ncbi:MAG: AraC family transcriptional regulator, partial [Kiritimatiellae bacterium]|nr:AraC family transcriptional regulator [Kiritimatiellia bacterium]